MRSRKRRRAKMEGESEHDDVDSVECCTMSAILREALEMRPGAPSSKTCQAQSFEDDQSPALKRLICLVPQLMRPIPRRIPPKRYRSSGTVAGTLAEIEPLPSSITNNENKNLNDNPSTSLSRISGSCPPNRNITSSIFTNYTLDNPQSVIVAGTYQSFDGLQRRVLLRPVKGQGDYFEDDETRFWASSDTWVTPECLYEAQRDRPAQSFAATPASVIGGDQHSNTGAEIFASFYRHMSNSRSKANEYVQYIQTVESALSEDQLKAFKKILETHLENPSKEASLVCEQSLIALLSKDHPHLLCHLAEFTRGLHD